MSYPENHDSIDWGDPVEGNKYAPKEEAEELFVPIPQEPVQNRPAITLESIQEAERASGIPSHLVGFPPLLINESTPNIRGPSPLLERYSQWRAEQSIRQAHQRFVETQQIQGIVLSEYRESNLDPVVLNHRYYQSEIQGNWDTTGNPVDDVVDANAMMFNQLNGFPVVTHDDSLGPLPRAETRIPTKDSQLFVDAIEAIRKNAADLIIETNRIKECGAQDLGEALETILTMAKRYYVQTHKSSKKPDETAGKMEIKFGEVPF